MENIKEFIGNSLENLAVYVMAFLHTSNDYIAEAFDFQDIAKIVMIITSLVGFDVTEDVVKEVIDIYTDYNGLSWEYVEIIPDEDDDFKVTYKGNCAMYLCSQLKNDKLNIKVIDGNPAFLELFREEIKDFILDYLGLEEEK